MNKKNAISRPWPRAMSVDLAADYVSLSKTTFLRMVADRTMPQPARITSKRQVWLRDHLDDYLLALFEVRPEDNGEEWLNSI